MSQVKKIALITGANRGIGFAIAQQLGEQGMIVLVGARDQSRGDEAARKLQSEGIEAHAVQLDVTNPDTIKAVASFVEATYGKLDILVNNAAIVPTQKSQTSDWRSWKRLEPTSEVSSDVLRTIYDTNAFGLLAVTQAMLPLLRHSDAGRIVNMSSTVGSLGLLSTSNAQDKYFPLPFGLAYSSSKTIVNSMTIFLANELYETAIKVNAACPGIVATDMNKSGARTPRQGAQIAVHLATLPADGPTGGFFDENGPIIW